MEEVAGHRVLRRAARGARSRLFLGHADGVTAVLKVCAPDDPRVPLELAALDRAAGEHVVALLDVAADETGAVLVLERLPGGTLADLLERRATLAAGEAVTILAPLAATIDRMHAAGVAHGALSLGAVAFDGSGSPSLTGFGSAELFPAGAPEVVRESVDGVRADRSALGALAGLVLGRVAGAGAEAARALVARLGELTPAALAEALYDLAVPAPVELDAAADPLAMRALDAGESVVPDESPPAVLPSWLVALVPDPWRERLQVALELALGTTRRVTAEWSPTRRRLALGLAAGILATVVALVLVPARPTTEPVPVPTPSADAASPPRDDLPDDPVAALRLLLARREECLRELSVLCLDDVVQPGSAAQADDVALVRAVLAGGELPTGGVAPGEPVLVERLGDGALLDLPAGSAPGSVLILRTAEGWRLRDYLEAPALSSAG